MSSELMETEGSNEFLNNTFESNISDESSDLEEEVKESFADRGNQCCDSHKCKARTQQKHECIDGKLNHDLEHLSSIPETIYSEKCLKELNLDYNEFSKIPDEFCEKMRQLKALSLLGNKLLELPSNIHLLESLEELHIDENHIKRLPLMFSQLNGLKLLNIQGNRLRSLPGDFNNLKQLKHLSLNENKLKSLPDSFGLLFNLVELDLSYNSISHLPQSIGFLSQLKVFNLSNNNISSLPSSFADLSHLEILELSNNSITLLPEEFASAKCLRKLFLDDNQICSLPKWIGDMEQIEEISLKCNYLRDNQFPESFGIKSQKLIKFDISGNLMNRLPESFAQIKTLQFIDTGSPLFEPERRKNMRNGNNLRYLPEFFGLNFLTLKDLRLDENDIEVLPQCFGDGMPNLEILDLYCNMISYLPDSFCKLKSLRQFSIGMNCLKKLPNDFGKLVALQELRMELNELKCLPPTFDELTNLRILDLYKNDFDVFPAILKNLENIKSLHVGLQISKMAINISSSEKFRIENLKRALNFGVSSRRKFTNVWDISKSFSFDNHNQSQSNDTSLQSSGYNSLQTSQDKVDDEEVHSSYDSWDADVFDPQRPYLNEALIYPNCHRIQTPLAQFKNFLPLKLHPNRILVKKLKLSPVEGQFDL